jgi:hypothetical protein
MAQAVTPAEQRELEQLRRIVAAYRELHREAWRPVEATWSQVKTGDILYAPGHPAWIVRRGDGETWMSNGGEYRRRPEEPVPASTVRVLAPIPPNMTDLLLASELGAACGRVDGEA